MSPPIDIDGSEIQEATIDGQDVSEITIDGQQAADLNVIPDSAIAHYDAKAAFGSGDDGTTITEWQDELGNYPLSGGSPTIEADAINGNRAPVFDGVDDLLDNTDISGTQPMTLFVAAQDDAGADGTFHPLIDNADSDDTTRVIIQWDDGDKWEANTGSEIVGSTDNSVQLFTFVIDGSSSDLRENGAYVAQDEDAGTGDLNSLRVGEDAGFEHYWTGPVAEILPVDEILTLSEIEEQEQRMADKWGITL